MKHIQLLKALILQNVKDVKTSTLMVELLTEIVSTSDLEMEAFEMENGDIVDGLGNVVVAQDDKPWCQASYENPYD